ncbi:MAG: alpha/beta hydrolase [Proteobacteria bacterium]|nr:alpha/beta hydrolase [Pseudomonadota bacterium]
MPPRLFFLPGAGADPAFWRPLADRLPTDWDKVFFGWPGLGHQPPDPAVNGIADLVAMVEARLDDRPVDLLAQSMGGAVAMAVTLRNPGRVRRLVLTVTAGGLDVPALGGSNWRENYRREYPNAAPWITEERPDHTAELPGVTQPTLLIWGDADPISPIAVGRRLEALLPNATLRIVPGGDHGFVESRPDDIAPWIVRHLS